MLERSQQPGRQTQQVPLERRRKGRWGGFGAAAAGHAPGRSSGRRGFGEAPPSPRRCGRGCSRSCARGASAHLGRQPPAGAGRDAQARTQAKHRARQCRRQQRRVAGRSHPQGKRGDAGANRGDSGTKIMPTNWRTAKAVARNTISSLRRRMHTRRKAASLVSRRARLRRTNGEPLELCLRRVPFVLLLLIPGRHRCRGLDPAKGPRAAARAADTRRRAQGDRRLAIRRFAPAAAAAAGARAPVPVRGEDVADREGYEDPGGDRKLVWEKKLGGTVGQGITATPQTSSSNTGAGRLKQFAFHGVGLCLPFAHRASRARRGSWRGPSQRCTGG